jgi:hypothetical protein
MLRVRGGVMVFKASLSNISVISWRSVLLVEETRVPGENQQPTASNWQTWSNNVVSSTPRHQRDSNYQLYWWYALITQIVVNPTTYDHDHDTVLNSKYMVTHILWILNFVISYGLRNPRKLVHSRIILNSQSHRKVPGYINRHDASNFKTL